jgi:NADPH:quinone reductase-like Zn-dependent oxidoreductase
MRALCLTASGGIEQLHLRDVPSPSMQHPGEVRIAVRAAAINHIDLWLVDGAPGLPVPPFPHIVGSDAAGVVLETGADVTHVRPGDRVMVNPGVSCGECDACTAGEEMFCRQFSPLGERRPGTAAEEIVLPGRNVARIDNDWSWAEAAAFPLATLTAWRMLTTRARVARDEAVLIWGIGGGVALAALQIARHLGARVAITSSSPEKLERAKPFGAELGLNHAEVEDVSGAVKRYFGRGVDVVVDSVGAPTWQRSLKAMRPGGRFVTCGSTGGPMVELDLRRLFWWQWSLLGSTMGTSREFADIVALANAGSLRPPIDAIFPLEKGADAFRRMAQGRQFGKLVLEVSA